MWLAFGAVTVVAAGVVAAWRRRASRWDGIRTATRTHRIGRDKSGDIDAVRVGIDTRCAPEFKCKPETGFDRLFKGWGLSRELQAQHRAFDDALYVVSDDPGVAAALRASPALAEDLRDTNL